jgi:hypothetical protein
MAKVGAQRAAELTGKSKSTIQRAMNSGKLSYELDNNDRRVIDVSELERVFGLQSGSNEKSSSSTSVEVEIQKAADLLEMERLKMQIKMLEQKLETSETQLEDVRAQRDQWQKQAQQILITSQYSQKQAEDYKAELKARDERAQKKREQVMAERMKKMQGSSQNQNQSQPVRSAAPKNGSGKPSESKPDSSSGNGVAVTDAGNATAFQSLWDKIRGSKAA